MKVKSIHQIELSSHCNLRCPYCPSRHLGREKLFMTRDHFQRALALIYPLVREGTQTELNLAGIGESTMHPHFAEFVGLARSTLGPSVDLTLATNGLTMDRALADELARHRMRVWVSLHRPEKAGPAVEHLRASGALAGVSADPAVASIDWAGQVNWHRSAAPGRGCQWTLGGRIMLMADGRFTRCCLDADARGVLGHVYDGLPSETGPYVLCQTCDLVSGPGDNTTDTGVKESIVRFKNLHKTRGEKINVDA